MHPVQAKFGFSDEDWQLARSFEADAIKAGWTRKEVETAFEAYRRMPRNLDAAGQYKYFTEEFSHCGMNPDRIAHGEVWLESTQVRLDQGLAPELPREPGAGEDAVRKADILRTMREDRAAYHKDEAMQRELHEIYEREGRGRPAENNGGAPTISQRAAATPTAPADRDARRAEIQRVMRIDRSRYWRDQDLQNEYRDLCADADTPSQPTDAPPAPSAGLSSSAGAEEGSPL